MASDSGQRAVANLPFSQGRSSASLDDYLEFRKMRGAYDVPRHREIKPGVYELVSRRGPVASRGSRRARELAWMFGFQEYAAPFRPKHKSVMHVGARWAGACYWKEPGAHRRYDAGFIQF